MTKLWKLSLSFPYAQAVAFLISPSKGWWYFPYFGHLMWRTDSLENDAGKDWKQEEKGTTEDEMVEWHHRLDGHEFEQAAGVENGQGGLACCSPWGRKESDTTEGLNWTELILELPSDFPYFLQFKSDFCNNEFMISSTVSSHSYFWWFYGDSPSLAAKNIICLIFYWPSGVIHV